MKRLFNKSFMLIVAVMLVFSLSVGLTFAYFSDYKVAEGEKVLTLGGQTEIEEEVTDNSKSVQIANTGKTTVITRVGIYGPNGMEITADESLWHKDGDFYYYTSPLKPGDKTQAGTLVAKVDKIPKDATGTEFDIIVVHETVQVSYDEDGNINKPEGWTYAPAAGEGE